MYKVGFMIVKDSEESAEVDYKGFFKEVFKAGRLANLKYDENDRLVGNLLLGWRGLLTLRYKMAVNDMRQFYDSYNQEEENGDITHVEVEEDEFSGSWEWGGVEFVLYLFGVLKAEAEDEADTAASEAA
jgi:hypothetical protein